MNKLISFWVFMISGLAFMFIGLVLHENSIGLFSFLTGIAFIIQVFVKLNGFKKEIIEKKDEEKNGQIETNRISRELSRGELVLWLFVVILGIGFIVMVITVIRVSS